MMCRNGQRNVPNTSVRDDLSDEDIRAALKYVAELANQESFHPLPAA
jgi:cytochrome c5